MWKASHLLGVLSFHGDGAFGAHQRFPGLLARKSMLGIAFGTLKNVGFSLTTKTAFASHFRCMRFVSHYVSPLILVLEK
jgi:hypothetical protein